MLKCGFQAEGTAVQSIYTLWWKCGLIIITRWLQSHIQSLFNYRSRSELCVFVCVPVWVCSVAMYVCEELDVTSVNSRFEIIMYMKVKVLGDIVLCSVSCNYFINR